MRYKKWSKKETEILRELYPSEATIDEILKRLPGRTFSAVHSKAMNLRLERP
jgi:hypothetical protein